MTVGTLVSLAALSLGLPVDAMLVRLVSGCFWLVRRYDFALFLFGDCRVAGGDGGNKFMREKTIVTAGTFAFFKGKTFLLLLFRSLGNDDTTTSRT